MFTVLFAHSCPDLNEEKQFESYLDARKKFSYFQWKAKQAKEGIVTILDAQLNEIENYDVTTMSPAAGKRRKGKKRTRNTAMGKQNKRSQTEELPTGVGKTQDAETSILTRTQALSALNGLSGFEGSGDEVIDICPETEQVHCVMCTRPIVCGALRWNRNKKCDCLHCLPLRHTISVQCLTGFKELGLRHRLEVTNSISGTPSTSTPVASAAPATVSTKVESVNMGGQTAESSRQKLLGQLRSRLAQPSREDDAGDDDVIEVVEQPKVDIISEKFKKAEEEGAFIEIDDD
jgi:hypothetical protein